MSFCVTVSAPASVNYLSKDQSVQYSSLERWLPICLRTVVAVENPVRNETVPTPTCGSSGVLPAILHHIEDTIDTSQEHILKALATAGLIGNLIKHNA